jgi:hypothetical protein
MALSETPPIPKLRTGLGMSRDAGRFIVGQFILRAPQSSLTIPAAPIASQVVFHPEDWTRARLRSWWSGGWFDFVAGFRPACWIPVASRFAQWLAQELRRHDRQQMDLHKMRPHIGQRHK